MSFISPIPTNTIALQASAVEGEVVLESTGPGLAICLSLTPEAVLTSLEPLRRAAEDAMAQRVEGSSMSWQDAVSRVEALSVGSLGDADPGAWQG